MDYFICDDTAEDNTEHVDGAVAVVGADWITVIRQALMPPSTSSDSLAKTAENQVSYVKDLLIKSIK